MDVVFHAGNLGYLCDLARAIGKPGGMDDNIYGGGNHFANGPDGKLYISVGDGSNAPKVQLMTSVLGKILRINDDGSIPEDNPFYDQTSGIYRAIYALGFRNSFSMAIQPGTGRIMATEVGSASWEEVNDILPGMNYGWPIIEGPLEPLVGIGCGGIAGQAH